MNCAMLLEMAADAFGDRIAVAAQGRSLTYGEMKACAWRVAEHLRAGGCRRLALLDTNGLAAPIALFGAARAGAAYVPLNYRLTSRELEQLLERLVPAHLVAATAYAASLSLPRGIERVDAETLVSGPIARGSVGADPALDAEGTASANASPADEDRAVAIQLFTSGTTGQPKAAVLRHENLLAYILGAVEFGSAGPEEAALIAVPPYHIAGVAAVLSSTYAGRRMVMLQNFDAGEWIRLCTQEGVTHAFVVPTMLARIVELLGRTGSPPLPSLRALAYGGGRMPLTVIEQALELLPDVAFTNAYGLTETSSTICLLGPDDHRSALASSDPAVRRRLASVGRPLPGVELQVRDESGRVLDPDEVGDVFVRGGQVAGEYQETGSLLDANGWFPTRDRGWTDTGGYLYLDGRADDIIIRGGENISPGEIEDTLRAHPAVADAAVVAIPSDQWGESVGAAVVLRQAATVSATDLQQWVRDQLRSSRVPERILFRDTLPCNEMGKVLRRRLRAEMSGQP